MRPFAECGLKLLVYEALSYLIEDMIEDITGHVCAPRLVLPREP
jgi:hypothetical protein